MVYQFLYKVVMFVMKKTHVQCLNYKLQQIHKKNLKNSEEKIFFDL